MRLILHNPHARISFWQTIKDFIIRNNMPKKANKYQYLLDFLWKKKIKFWIYLDYKDSSLPTFLHKQIFIKIEVFFRLLMKRINPLRVQIIDKVKQLRKDDIFLSFSLTTLDTDYHGIDAISDQNFIKIFHFTHYNQNTSLIAKNFERLKWDFIIAENNLKKSDYFNNFFKYFSKEVYTLPFTYGKRYNNTKPFDKRRNMCLSVGAIINIKDYKGLFDDFTYFYHTDTIQPLRKEILNDMDKITDYIETANANFKTDKSSIWGKIKKIIFWYKHTYFKFDMVEKFNQYKMFVCGEELGDLPGIWFVEWMACGSAYIGKIHTMYTDLGLVPWVHYIWYNGTLKDVIEKIKYYQEHEEELEKIAKNGYEFVKNRLSWEVVAENFYNDLVTLNKALVANNYNKEKLVFTSSSTSRWNQ